MLVKLGVVGEGGPPAAGDEETAPAVPTTGVLILAADVQGREMVRFCGYELSRLMRREREIQKDRIRCDVPNGISTKSGVSPMPEIMLTVTNSSMSASHCVWSSPTPAATTMGASSTSSLE